MPPESIELMEPMGLMVCMDWMGHMESMELIGSRQLMETMRPMESMESMEHTPGRLWSCSLWSEWPPWES